MRPSSLKPITPQPAQQKFLRSDADICVYGGAAGGGKTYSLLMEPLYHVRDNPGFGAVIFRRTYTEITQQGGIWDQSCKIYPQLGAVANLTDLEWTFPTGARVKFAHLQHEKTIYGYQSSEIALIEFDELTSFTEQQFWYMLSRNRSMCGVKPYMRAGTNPDADSWVSKLLEWWIDQDTGLPIAERAGCKRWFVRENDTLMWASDPAELRQRYPDSQPKSLEFVPAKLSDNAALMAADPGYLANLLALPTVERERLLAGNWKIRPAAGLIFNRSWFDIVESSPLEATRIRWWDKACLVAGTMVSTINGLKPIEQICAGEFVLTRYGYKEVEWSGQTGIVEETTSVKFANGQTITGTPDHMIWTQNRGWIGLADICCADYALYIAKGGNSWASGKVGNEAITRKPLNLMASHTQGGRVRGISQPIVGTRSTKGIGQIFCTVPFGVSIMEIFRPGTIFTTKTEIETTMWLIIWSAYQKANTFVRTALLQIGTKVRQPKRTTPSYRKSSGKMLRIRNTPALIATGNFRQGGLMRLPSIARHDAAIGIGVPVYDLQVKDAHEFFANGVLVHNSTQGGGDWSAGVKVSRDEDGVFYVENVVRGQWRSLDRNKTIKQTAIMDGIDCEIGLEQEPGSGGKESAEISIRDLAGFVVHAERTTGNKLTLARPFASQCEARNVKIVRGEWNEAFLAELHRFTGQDGKVDDQVDAASKAFNRLANAFLDGWEDTTHPANKSAIAQMPKDVFERGGMGYNRDGDDDYNDDSSTGRGDFGRDGLGGGGKEDWWSA